jgi:hypothetical protein
VIEVELGTFGAIMKFAMEIEQEVNKFYESASSFAKDSNLMNQFQKLHKRGEKRLKTLERVRRENVTEMILEPIHGLDSENYKFDSEILSTTDEIALVELARAIEKGLFDFYSQAAAKIDFLIEASYAFELLAEANEQAIESLSKTFS